MSNTDTRQALARKLVDDFAVAFLYGNVAQRIAAGDAIVAALATQPAQPSKADQVRAIAADFPDKLFTGFSNLMESAKIPDKLFTGFSNLMESAKNRGSLEDVAYIKSLRDLFSEVVRAFVHYPPAAQPSATPNNDEVICPNCAHQFRAIPVNVQRLMLDAGFEPPFTAQPSAQGEAVAWLVKWKAHGYGPQWWGFNHTPGKNATWCSDANNAIRFARKEDAERMRLHIIAVAGLTGMHEYERSVSVTEHMWEGPCRAN